MNSTNKTYIVTDVLSKKRLILRQQVFFWCSIRDFAPGTAKQVFASLLDAIPGCRPDSVCHTLEHDRHRVDVATDGSFVVKQFGCFFDVHHPVQVYDVCAALEHVGQQAGGVAADMQSSDGAHLMNSCKMRCS